MTHKPTKAGAKAMGKIKAAGKIMKGETGILSHLAEEHGEVDALMKRVSTSNDVDVREDLFPEIRTKLLSHAQAEEEEFYPVLRNLGLTDLVERSIEQHREVELLVEQLDADDKSRAAWHTTFEQMVDAVQEHVQLEEQEIFPQVEDRLDSNDLTHTLEKYERAQKAAEKRLG